MPTEHTKHNTDNGYFMCSKTTLQLAHY